MTNPAHRPTHDPTRYPTQDFLAPSALSSQDEPWSDPEQPEHGRLPHQRQPESPWGMERDPLTGRPLQSIGDRDVSAGGYDEASSSSLMTPGTPDGYATHRTEQMPRYGRPAVEAPFPGSGQIPTGAAARAGGAQTGGPQTASAEVSGGQGAREQVRNFPTGTGTGMEQGTGYPQGGGAPGGASADRRGFPPDRNQDAASGAAAPAYPLRRDGPATAVQPVIPGPAPEPEAGIPSSLASMLSTDGERVFQPTEVMDTGDAGRRPGSGRRGAPGADDATMAHPMVRRKPPWMSRFAALVMVASAVLIAAVPAFVVLSHGLFGKAGVAPPAAVGGVLMLLGLPVLGAGLYPLLSGAARVTDDSSLRPPHAAREAEPAAGSSTGWQVLSRPPTAYLLVGLVLLLASAVAVG